MLLNDDNLPLNQWQLARVVEAEPDVDGLVRKVKVAVADPNLTKSGRRVKPACFLERLIQKLVVLVPCESSQKTRDPHARSQVFLALLSLLIKHSVSNH